MNIYIYIYIYICTRLSDLIKQRFDALELYKRLATKTCLGFRKIRSDGHTFVLGVCFFSKICSPRRAGNITPTYCKLNPKMFVYYRLQTGFARFHMRFRCNNKQVHLTTSPTCFKRPRDREIWFRVPGPENWV